jgi:hypothetical protein
LLTQLLLCARISLLPDKNTTLPVPAPAELPIFNPFQINRIGYIGFRAAGRLQFGGKGGDVIIVPIRDFLL